MKTIFSLILLITLSANLHASVMFIERASFACSDGKSYDVARHYSGGWGPGGWEFIALCDGGTLKQETYNGRIFPLRDASPEIAACIDAVSPSIIACFDEFRAVNPTKGEGGIPAIIQKVKESPQRPVIVPQQQPRTLPM